MWEVKSAQFYRKQSDGLPSRACMLIVARNVLKPDEIKYFVANRVPDDVHSVAGLETWLRGLPKERAKLLHMRLEDLHRTDADTEWVAQFPDRLDVNGTRLPLRYHFAPGEPDDGGALLPATDEVDPALVDWVNKLPRRERYSFVYDCSAQVLDHILTNRAAGGWVRGIEFGRGNADSPAEFQSDPASALRSSDHDGVVIYIGSRPERAEAEKLGAAAFFERARIRHE